MYSRDVAGQVRNFEASGSLYHSALVMQDSVTDSYWAVISSEAIAGADQGTALTQLPISEKITWGEWKKLHPETVILSVDGAEDVESNPYENYFESDNTFRNMKTTDTRLPNKEPIFAFTIDDQAYAVPHTEIEGGYVGDAGGITVFLYRSKGASLYRSTLALRLDWSGASTRIDPDGRLWVTPAVRLDPESGSLVGDSGAANRLEGLDTFWHIWSTYHTTSEILSRGDA